MTGRVAAVRLGPVSASVRPRSVAVGGVLVVLAGAALALSVARGDFPLPLPQVVAILLGGGEDGERFVVLGLRLPRALTGILVGFVLGVAGAVTQAVSRNPLASPDVLGVTAGASAGAVAVIVAAPALGTALGVSGAALVGGLVAAAAVYVLAWRRGLDGFRLVLVGVAVTYFCASLVSWFLVRAEVNDAARATVWLNGSLNGASWGTVPPVLAAVALTALVAVPAAFALRVLTLGEDSAAGLGIRVNTVRTVLLLVAVALASVATAAAGPVPFVALAAPQIAVRLLRSAIPPLLASGLTGAALLTASDVVARGVLPVPLPVGVVTGVLGAPFLLYLIRRRTREATA